MRGQPDLPRYYRPVTETMPFVIDINGDSSADECRIVCRYFACDTRPFKALLGSLPRMLHAPVSTASWEWMSRLLDAAIKATGPVVALMHVRLCGRSGRPPGACPSQYALVGGFETGRENGPPQPPNGRRGGSGTSIDVRAAYSG